MKNRIDYWTNGTRHPLKLSAYALALIANHPGGRSAAITEAITAWLGTDPDALQTFCSQHEGMNLSLAIEVAISRRFDH